MGSHQATVDVQQEIVPTLTIIIISGIVKSIKADGGDAGGDVHLAQIGATLKRLVANGGDTLGNLHRRQALTAKEGGVCDGGDRLALVLGGDNQLAEIGFHAGFDHVGVAHQLIGHVIHLVNGFSSYADRQQEQTQQQ